MVSHKQKPTVTHAAPWLAENQLNAHRKAKTTATARHSHDRNREREPTRSANHKNEKTNESTRHRLPRHTAASCAHPPRFGHAPRRYPHAHPTRKKHPSHKTDKIHKGGSRSVAPSCQSAAWGLPTAILTRSAAATVTPPPIHTGVLLILARVLSTSRPTIPPPSASYKRI